MRARWVIIFLLALLVSILHLILFLSPYGQKLEPIALDYWFIAREQFHTPKPPEEVLLIAMDEQSYALLDIPLTHVWPRGVHGKLLQKLKQYGAKRVAFDILFLGEGPDPAQDALLIEGLKQVPSVLGSEIAVRHESTLGGTFVLEEYQEPYDPFMEQAFAAGLVSFPANEGTIRSFTFERPKQFEHIPSLSEAAAGITERLAEELPGPRDLINYYGPPGRIRRIYYHRVLEEELPMPHADQIFKDKVVFVGLLLRTERGPAQKDVFNSPFYGPKIYGSEVHATAAANLIRKDWIRRSSLWKEAMVMSALVLIVCGLIFSLRPQWAMLVSLIYVATWAAGSYYFFLQRWLLPGVSFLGILIVCLTGSIFHYYLVTRKAERQMRGALEHYVSPTVAKQLAANPASLKLGGEKVWATVMFTDISSFTATTENMPAEQVSKMLNEYFTEVMQVIMDNHGTLVKFIGDAVFAMWGAPLRVDNHAELAIKSAAEVQREVERFNNSGRFPALHTRIGLNTGSMVVGNLGSKRRFDYTAIGDAVNLASRVEGLNKYFGTSILVTENIRKELGVLSNAVHMGAVKVSGKEEVVELYALFAKEFSQEITENWDKAISCFRRRDWSTALTLFEKLSHHPDLEKATLLYKTQIQSKQNAAPEPSWLGEIEFFEK